MARWEPSGWLCQSLFLKSPCPDCPGLPAACPGSMPPRARGPEVLPGPGAQGLCFCSQPAGGALPQVRPGSRASFWPAVPCRNPDQRRFRMAEPERGAMQHVDLILKMEKWRPQEGYPSQGHTAGSNCLLPCWAIPRTQRYLGSGTLARGHRNPGRFFTFCLESQYPSPSPHPLPIRPQAGGPGPFPGRRGAQSPRLGTHWLMVSPE